MKTPIGILLVLTAWVAQAAAKDKTQGELALWPELQWQPGIGGLSKVSDHYYLNAGQVAEYSLVWTPGDSFEPNKKPVWVFVHFTDKSGKVVLIDDHELPEAVWREGKTTSYRRMFCIPAGSGARRVTAIVGLYNKKNKLHYVLRHGTETIAERSFGPLYAFSVPSFSYYNGWYQPDVVDDAKAIRWMQRRGECGFRNPHHPAFLHIVGGSVQTCVTAPLHVAISINDKPLEHITIPASLIDEVIPLSLADMGEDNWCSLTLESNQTFQPSSCQSDSKDDRSLSIYVENIELSSVHFGAGWYPEERTKDDSWRWCSGSGRITCPNYHVPCVMLCNVTVPATCFKTKPVAEMFIGDRSLGSFTVSETAGIWEVRFDPGTLCGADACEIEFRINQTFIPAQCGSGNDTRALGFMLRNLDVFPLTND